MHKLAKKILSQALPTLEKMLDEGISEKELYTLECQVTIAHDLIECDMMLDKMSGAKEESPGYFNTAKSEY